MDAPAEPPKTNQQAQPDDGLVTCYVCRGRGTYHGHQCKRCGGKGRTPRTNRGAKPGEYRGGRKSGTRNKRTVVKEHLLDALKAPEFKELIGEIITEQPQRPDTPARKKAVDIMAEFLPAIASHAARLQNKLVELVTGGAAAAEVAVAQEAFNKAAELLFTAGGKVAPYESPRFSAVIVGAAVVNKIEVVGGMPDDFAPPKDVNAIAPGTIIEADVAPAAGTDLVPAA